ncbi:MAG: MFS transporter [Gemmatimonadota bacterium]|nr:MAG: MFS transporter [Gemmatimonadota bacterium]
MTTKQPFQISTPEESGVAPILIVHRPDNMTGFLDALMDSLGMSGLPETVEASQVSALVRKAIRPIQLHMTESKTAGPYAIQPVVERGVEIRVANPDDYDRFRNDIIAELRTIPELATVSGAVVDDLFERGSRRPFLLIFVALLLLTAFAILKLEPLFKAAPRSTQSLYIMVTLGIAALLIWLLPGLSLFTRILTSVIFVTVLSIYQMDLKEMGRFRNHWRFLFLVFLYSGFWVLYFQMFDSVLWYVNAYVDATPLNSFVNSIPAIFGVQTNWFFDVEHVTVINAGTIIVLMLLISNIVNRTKALPTMMVGIGLGTVGMAILAINTNIWVFMIGITVFSIGEMTTHPKFISYVGLTAPKDRVATYMGYIFLYGVIGSSIGAPVGAKLYVQFVDNMNQPRTLWIIFSCIGVFTILALLLYNKFLAPKEQPTPTPAE